ncbi:MAG: hydroxymethylglutaryl-CoA synthase [Candidatus Aenigmatarchaeota archaeon]
MIGIVGYGGYVPRYRIKVEEIARIWGENPDDIKSGLVITEKSVPALDEDTITMSVEAAKQAIKRAGINPKEIGALYIGSESHPYIVKPSGTVVAEAIGANSELNVVDMEFACKAGTTALLLCAALVQAGWIKYGMAIGADCAQSKPGDALEYTAAAGAAAFLIGHEPLAILEGFYSYTTDTSDFWRREGESYPSHAARFTGKPAYFKHVTAATQGLLSKLGLKVSDFDYAVFHMPNGKFPITVATQLGFKPEQYETGLVVKKIGNCYSASSLLGLCTVLDCARPGQRILLTSYGSGAGSDSFSFIVTDKIEERRNAVHPLSHWINKKTYIDYGMYTRLRRKLKI